MESLKKLFVVTILCAVGYGVYVMLTGAPTSDSETASLAPEWPEVTTPDGGAAPVYVSPATPSAEGGVAPPFQSEGGAPTASLPTAVAPVAPPQTTLPPATTDAPQYAASAEAPRYPSTGVDSLYEPASPVAAGGYAPMSSSSPAAPSATVPSTSPADSTTSFAAALTEAQTLLDQQRLDEALLALSQWYWRTELSSTERKTLEELLSQLAGTVIYSRDYSMEPHYVVREGDTLESIAQACQTPPQLLAKINGIPEPYTLTPGQTLKIVRGPFEAVVDLSTNELTLFLRGRYAGRFPITTGADLHAQVGEFQVTFKETNPTYYGARVIGPNDPQNPLGERWIELGTPGERRASAAGVLGIHGGDAAQPNGPGYIRVADNGVEDVFDILSVGSRVTLRR